VVHAVISETLTGLFSRQLFATASARRSDSRASSGPVASHGAATLGPFLHQISYCYYPDTTDRRQVAEVGLAHTAHAQKGHPYCVFFNHTNMCVNCL
jgi:hypothetical protein